MLNSCIYEGLIRHRRNAPRVHQFDFRSFFLMLDLDELDQVFSNRWLWSNSRRSLARFNEQRHLKSFRSAGDLRRRVDAVLNDHGMNAKIGSVRLLTQLSYFGFAMNPVSFFYCFDPDENVIAIIAEVNNTPWGQQHVYVVTRSPRAPDPQRTLSSENIEKTFHVSPFMPMAMTYRMAFSNPGEKLGVKIENHLHEPVDGKRKILDVTMLMKRKAITTSRLNRLLLAYPLISFKIMIGIYWQAFRLRLKKTPFYAYPKSNTTNVLESESELETLLPAVLPLDSTPAINQEQESVLVSR